MAADLGSTTYSAVAWTAGDVITEAKLDAMVGNDQAYDSHAAQGLLLNNNKALAAKDAAGVNHNIIKLNASDILEISGNDGWNKLPTENVPTYASATTLTNPTGIDWTKYLKKGDKVKFTQTSAKYFYVTAVTSTVLTLLGGSAYSVANAAISDFFYSKQEDPVGFPDGGWLAYTVTLTGSGSNPTANKDGRFRIDNGGSVEVEIITSGITAPGSGTYEWSLPIPQQNNAGYAYGAGWAVRQGVGIYLGYLNPTIGVSVLRLVNQADNTSFAHNNPAAWQNGDYINITARYRI